MLAYKLVVLDPFDNYQRGSEIIDQNLVTRILDINDEMHVYERHVRKVVYEINPTNTVDALTSEQELDLDDSQSKLKKSSANR